jgi:hypothetical protein
MVYLLIICWFHHKILNIRYKILSMYCAVLVLLYTCDPSLSMRLPFCLLVVFLCGVALFYISLFLLFSHVFPRTVGCVCYLGYVVVWLPLYGVDLCESKSVILCSGAILRHGILF